MKEHDLKSAVSNSCKVSDAFSRVNVYSTIPFHLVSEMVSVDFPSIYNCVVVHFFASSDFLEPLVEDFVKYAETCFSVVLIQFVGFDKAILNVFSPNNLKFIHSCLFDFELSQDKFDFRMQY